MLLWQELFYISFFVALFRSSMNTHEITNHSTKIKLNRLFFRSFVRSLDYQLHRFCTSTTQHDNVNSIWSTIKQRITGAAHVIVHECACLCLWLEYALRLNSFIWMWFIETVLRSNFDWKVLMLKLARHTKFKCNCLSGSSTQTPKILNESSNQTWNWNWISQSCTIFFCRHFRRIHREASNQSWYYH